MIQDTSPSPELYLFRLGDKHGGWGLVDDDAEESADQVDYNDLRERTVVWGTSVPGVGKWCEDVVEEEVIIACVGLCWLRLLIANLLGRFVEVRRASAQAPHTRCEA